MVSVVPVGVSQNAYPRIGPQVSTLGVAEGAADVDEGAVEELELMADEADEVAVEDEVAVFCAQIYPNPTAAPPGTHAPPQQSLEVAQLCPRGKQLLDGEGVLELAALVELEELEELVVLCTKGEEELLDEEYTPQFPYSG